MSIERGLVPLVDFNDEIVLYSTDCPKCKVLESKLQTAGIFYTKNTNVDTMLSLGFTTTPKLKVNNKYLDFSQAVKWVNSKIGKVVLD